MGLWIVGSTLDGYKITILDADHKGLALCVAIGIELDELLHPWVAFLVQDRLLEGLLRRFLCQSIQDDVGGIETECFWVSRLSVEAILVGGVERKVGRELVVAIEKLGDSESFYPIAAEFCQTLGRCPF